MYMFATGNPANDLQWAYFAFVMCSALFVYNALSVFGKSILSIMLAIFATSNKRGSVWTNLRWNISISSLTFAYMMGYLLWPL